MMLNLSTGISLVFHDWQRDGESIRGTERDLDLSLGSFHGGTTFPKYKKRATISLSQDDLHQLRQALAEGYTPIFYISEVC